MSTYTELDEIKALPADTRIKSYVEYTSNKLRELNIPESCHKSLNKYIQEIATYNFIAGMDNELSLRKYDKEKETITILTWYLHLIKRFKLR